VQTFSGGGHLNVLLSLLFGYDRRVEVEVIFADGVIAVKSPVIGFSVPVNIAEFFVDLLHYNSCGEIVDGGIHNLVEPFDLSLVPESFGNIVSKRPVTLFTGVVGDVIHRTVVSQNLFVYFRRMVGHETAASTMYGIFATLVPSLLCRHVCGDVVDFQLTDVLVFVYSMVVQKTAVGEDDCAIRFGGKDTLLGIVDGVRQRIDIVSAMLYVRDILDVPFDVETTVGKLFAQISLDTHIENLPVQADTITDALHVELFFVYVPPFLEALTILFHDQFHVLLNGNILDFFFA